MDERAKQLEAEWLAKNPEQPGWYAIEIDDLSIHPDRRFAYGEWDGQQWTIRGWTYGSPNCHPKLTWIRPALEEIETIKAERDRLREALVALCDKVEDLGPAAHLIYPMAGQGERVVDEVLHLAWATRAALAGATPAALDAAEGVQGE